jgi:rhodanese-related sulfurtransferase
MKTIVILFVALFSVCLPTYAGDNSLEKFISNFDYEARNDMKIDAKALIQLIKEGRAQLIDIRFPEEYAAWRIGFSKNIPLNELPDRLKEIDNSKIIVTACPHLDRATIAMVYLRSRGIQAKYLKDGLIGLAENLRGDDAKLLINAIGKQK